MRKILLFSSVLIVAFCFCLPSYGFSSNPIREFSGSPVQQSISGRVTTANGEPLAGVTVTYVGTTITTGTNSSGEYTIQAPIGSTLRFSYLGYKTEQLRANQTRLDMILTEESNSINEVVVVGYGQQKRSNLTGAVTSVNAAEVFHNRPIPDPARGLQGVVPGLNIRIPSGEVGSDPLLRIRGQVGSINGGAAPLVLVDNVEVPSLQYVNSNDIETITVLKDAASTSIYGAKAAFGVVLITTKKGSTTEKTEITYSNNFVTQSPFTKIEVAGIEGLEYTQDAHLNMKQTGPAGGFWRIDLDGARQWLEKYGNTITNDDPVVYGRDWYWDGIQKFGLRLYDPVSAMIDQNTFSQMHNFGVNGKSGNTTYNLGLGFVDQRGMMKPAKRDDYIRFNPSLRVETKLTDFMRVRGGILYADAKKHYPTSLNIDGFAADPWVYLYRWSRLFPIDVLENGQEIISPSFSAAHAPPALKHDRFMNLNVGTTLDITKNWNIVGDYSFNAENLYNSSAVPHIRAKTHWYGVSALVDENGNPIYVDENGNVTDTGGSPAYEFPVDNHTLPENTFISRGSVNRERHTFNAYSTYNLQVADQHDFKFMLGTNIVSYEWIDHTSTKTGYLINGDNPQFQWGFGEQRVSGGNAWESQVGLFGRFNYAFADKYLFEANLRRDGSSKFPPHLRWQWFPSFSGGWVVTQESFMENLNPVLSFLKFRASWGSIGDQTVSNSLYVPTMGVSQNSWIGATDRLYQLGTPGQVLPDIAWQRIEHTNVGADIRFFQDRLGITVDWFQRYTKDMLMAGESVAATLGTAVPTGNYGDLRTRGLEFNIDYTHVFENGLRLFANANFADASTFITRGPDWNIPYENRSLASTWSTGRRYGDIYGFVTDRLYQKDDFVYDADGNFVTTTIVRNGTARTMNVLVGDNPVYQPYFQDGGSVMVISPGDVKFKDLNGDGYIDNGLNTNGDPGDLTVIGNSTPRYEYGFRLGADFKGFELSMFLQGVGKRSIWGSGQLAIPGYHVRDGAMPLAIASDYWREDRPDAFYPRAWHLGNANEGWVMRTQSRYMLDMSYLRIKNITLGYQVPTRAIENLKMRNLRLFISLENMFTFDNLRGLPIDPEAISGVSPLPSSNYGQGRTSISNPAFKSASAGLQIGF